jgi:Polysaccharide biosynthesis enzyme WcbI
LDAAYIFGNTGNLTTGLGRGWSVEDEFAWAVGYESELTLSLHEGHVAYVLRFDVHPAIFPPKVPHQRLMVRAGKTVLGSFELTARETLTIRLPVELTAGVTHLELTLIHPDAVQPRDHLPVDDSRRLALCFHSASLARQWSEGSDPSSVSDRVSLEPVHGVIAGGPTARRICEIISKLPALKGRFGMRFLDLSRPLEETTDRLPPETVDTVQFCWLELNASFPEPRDQLRRRLPAACAVRTFYSPIIRSLWPFQGPDSRAVVEPGRYQPSRYPYGDRLTHALSAISLPDDVLYTMYEMSAEQELLDLDEIFADDLRRWRAEGRKTDMQLADFIERHISASRVFIAANRVGPPLMREMVDQVLDDGLVRDVATPETLSRQLDALLEGYLGGQEEIPINKRVAEHFNLSWWSPDMTYRWMNNLRTHRDHILDTIKWAQWRT